MGPHGLLLQGAAGDKGGGTEALVVVTGVAVADTTTSWLTHAIMQTGRPLPAHTVEASLVKALCFIQSASLHRVDPLLELSVGGDK